MNTRTDMSNINEGGMEFEKNISFDLLFEDNLNPEKILPLIRKCVSVSKNDSEIIRAVEIALCTCIQNLSIDDLEDLFKFVCPAGASVFISRVKLLEEKSKPVFDGCVTSFNVCLKIVNHFQYVFEYLNKGDQMTLSRVESLLTSSLEILLKCFCHCKRSEEIYGEIFNSLTDALSGFFKKCCSLLDQLLDFVTEKSVLDLESGREIALVDGLLCQMSKCGIIMVNLEVKTMAKIWKTYVYLLEKYLCVLKMEHKIGDTISALCGMIITNLGAFKLEDGKLIKLSCFLLKLVMKLCEIFNGELGRCHGSLFNLLLILCKCEGGLLGEKNSNEDLLSQLTVGVDPLLLLLVSDKHIVREFGNCQDVEKCQEFCLLCCLVLKKLSNSNASVRCLWINDTDNILDWMLKAASTSEFVGFSSVRLPKVLINWQPMKYTDLYEYVLVSFSAFLITASAEEFVLVEKVLIRNILQPTVVPALLAMDIWCFLARIADSDLCYTQILTLSEMYKKFHPQTTRVEKLFLASLIRRLFPFLTDSRQKEYLKSLPPAFYSTIWDFRTLSCIPRDKVCDIIQPIVSQSCQLVRKLEPKIPQSLNGNEHTIYVTFGSQILDSWKFNPDLLSSNPDSLQFLKMSCGLVACIAPFLPPEELFTVLCQVKKLLSTRVQPTAVKLYFLWILTALSSVSIPPGNNQRKITLIIAEIFRELLSSREILAKQKTLEVFEYFTKVTTHEEVITMTVHNSPELKMEVMDYLRKKQDRPPDNVEDYLRGIFRLKWEHFCDEKEPELGGCIKRIKLDIPDLEKIVGRFREDGGVIREYAGCLSEVQKREIKNICSFILSKV